MGGYEPTGVAVVPLAPANRTTVLNKITETISVVQQQIHNFLFRDSVSSSCHFFKMNKTLIVQDSWALVSSATQKQCSLEQPVWTKSARTI